MSADIVKFYPQTMVNPNHRNYQRFVWRESPDLPILVYRTKRLTFGTTPAPFIAIRGLHQLANDECANNESLKRIIKEDFLVDNLLTGANSIEQALTIQSDVLQIMEKGKLELRKWTSNAKEILESVDKDHRECELPLQIHEDQSSAGGARAAVKTIGILWHPENDTFGISIVAPDISITPTKRLVLSAIARIFDPLGWLSPVTIRLKILMQELWKAKLGWDDQLPHNLLKDWINYVEDLNLLRDFKINRCVASAHASAGSGASVENCHYELHGFSDASILAYSACVYLKSLNNNGSSYVNLVIAKTKVAPIKFETLPRLELCGCALLTKLMGNVQKACNLDFDVIRCWTDSTIVLDWFSSEKKLPVFVNNRVRKIGASYAPHYWFHVKGTENPADSASRGISAASLLNHNLWYHGPPWLATTSFQSNLATSSNVAKEAAPLLPAHSVIYNISNYTCMKRAMARVLRFVYNIKVPKNERKIGPPTLLELDQALLHLVRAVQAESFIEELSSCKRKMPVKSSVKFLSPFVDLEGILRVGGRLQNSSLTDNQKHPILLPRHHRFTDAVVRYYHRSNLHAPPQLLLALNREQFWIVRGPDMVRQYVRKCITCFKQNHGSLNQIMGQLPAPRVNQSVAFSQTGLDFAGPFYICTRPGRNPVMSKSYVCVFVCMATRAIHLELVGDLSTPSFIASLRRFISRRGRPTEIYCDGGKNFVGAANEIKEFTKFINAAAGADADSAQRDSASDFLIEKGINFHFNPPASPHHGGLWEAGVKAMKHHLRRVTEDRRLSIEEFTTLLCEVEAALNSRPLTPLSADPNDLNVLTPGHFLVGGNLSALPDPDVTHINSNRLSRWQLVQQMFQHFWRRWSSEYLKMLQSRPKWYSPQPNLEVGILVLINDDDLAWGPVKWKLGRIIKTYPGEDGRVRVCDVKTSAGSVLKRPIVKLSPLPIYGST